MYASTGTLLDQFTLPTGSYNNPFAKGIEPYVDYTPDGHVFIFSAGLIGAAGIARVRRRNAY